MPRKTGTGPMLTLTAKRASMRPRPDAAENADVDIDNELTTLASMRPRPDAAENMLDGRQHLEMV